MIRLWAKFLPYIFVVWFCKRYGERFNYDLGKYGNVVLVSPEKGVLIILEK